MIKKIISSIWEKIKKYRSAVIIYLVMLLVSVMSDVFFGGFNLLKYIAYAILLAIFIIVMIVYKDKIKQAIDDIENKIDSSINKQYVLNKGNSKEELIYNLSSLQDEIKKDIINNLENINNPKIEVKITDEKN
ncbi:hypothetical protein WESB_0299 [Brachyspira pilosicoli WesB]|uniref:Uncharacterized protein n=1 Tax=Brachyspira pilosicoli WesB TaxID=1161918 RepID=K0JHG5_BRAPL|nr:hypothetical protein [Brachyspira pilosicoli]CCG55770.1 hypothetical protein WESB_0299 [Brachyspira pilosicoli WesB]